MSVTFVYSAFAVPNTEEEDAPSSSRKRKCEDKKPDGEENSKRTKGPTTSLNEAPSSIVYEIGPPSWLKREISAHMLSDQLVRTKNNHLFIFCLVMLFSKNELCRECYDNKQA